MDVRAVLHEPTIRSPEFLVPDELDTPAVAFMSFDDPEPLDDSELNRLVSCRVRHVYMIQPAGAGYKSGRGKRCDIFLFGVTCDGREHVVSSVHGYQQHQLDPR